MSKRYLAKLAGAVALGGAALLLGTPTAAMAYDGGASDSNTCGTIEQSNEAAAVSVFERNFIEDSEIAIAVEQSVNQENSTEFGPNTNIVTVCINDVELDLELD
ncbi:hypothetical protein ACIBXA_23100 [Micromonospora echinaurantiaca]|uniref:hypothetical protein n=1 Tax=Micromonospora TaxID=1873 RepID=UPI000D70189A|nr:hypothetical protein [Micromonospora sp. S4605]PWU57850.1 hypothetical protein DLJ47_01280 [Micromonospora sp. S4605]